MEADEGGEYPSGFYCMFFNGMCDLVFALKLYFFGCAINM
jgi:hypothetical protein